MQGKLLYGNMQFKKDNDECKAICSSLRTESRKQQKMRWHDRWSYRCLHWNDLVSFNDNLHKDYPPPDPYGSDGIFSFKFHRITKGEH